MKIKMKVKYPCGYEFEINNETGIFDTLNFDSADIEFKVCPIHGKKCNRCGK